MQTAKKTVDKVRRGEQRALLKEGADRLSRTKYVWLTCYEPLSEKQQYVSDATYDPQLQTGDARAYQEMLGGKRLLKPAMSHR